MVSDNTTSLSPCFLICKGRECQHSSDHKFWISGVWPNEFTRLCTLILHMDTDSLSGDVHGVYVTQVTSSGPWRTKGLNPWVCKRISLFSTTHPQHFYRRESLPVVHFAPEGEGAQGDLKVSTKAEAPGVVILSLRIAVIEYSQEGKNHFGRSPESDSVSGHKINYGRFWNYWHYYSRSMAQVQKVIQDVSFLGP